MEDEKVIIARVDGYGPKPRSAAQALEQAHAMFTEEGYWASGTFFEDGDPKEAYEAASCGSWRACAMGGLGLVTGEMPISVVHEHDTDEELREKYERDLECGYIHSDTTWETYREEFTDETYWFAGGDDNIDFDSLATPLSYKAAQFLAWVILEDRGLDADDIADRVQNDPVDIVISNNDSNTRTKVLEWFAKAIEKAKKGKLPKKNDAYHTSTW